MDLSTKPRPTLRAVAEQLGISSMTVSKSLRGIGRISEEMRRRVREKAEEIGYLSTRERLFPPFLRGAAADHRLRILCPTVEGVERGDIHPYRNDMISGLAKAVTPGHDEIVVEGFRSLSGLLEFLRRERFHGVALSEPYPTRWTAAVREVCSVVYTVGHDFQDGVDAVYFNEARAATLAVNRLVQAGHQQIAWLGVLDRNAPFHLPDRHFDGEEGADRLALSVHGTRYAAWMYLASQYPHLGQWPVKLIERDWASMSLADAVRRGCHEILRESPRPTAIVCVGNLVAREAIAQLRQAGFEIPRDISVVSYGVEEDSGDDLPLSGLVMPMERVGALVPEVLQRRLAYPQGLHLSIQLDALWSPGQTLAPLSRVGS